MMYCPKRSPCDRAAFEQRDEHAPAETLSFSARVSGALYPVIAAEVVYAIRSFIRVNERAETICPTGKR